VHEVEFSLGSPEILCALRFRHSLEIPEGLKRANAETEIPAGFCDIACLPSKDIKSLSKISTASKPAAAMACSFLSKVPLTETVAIEYFMIGLIPFIIRSSASSLG